MMPYDKSSLSGSSSTCLPRGYLACFRECIAGSKNTMRHLLVSSGTILGAGATCRSGGSLAWLPCFLSDLLLETSAGNAAGNASGLSFGSYAGSLPHLPSSDMASRCRHPRRRAVGAVSGDANATRWVGCHRRGRWHHGGCDDIPVVAGFIGGDGELPGAVGKGENTPTRRSPIVLGASGVEMPRCARHDKHCAKPVMPS